MDKREWQCKSEQWKTSDTAPLWAIVERLEALVAIGDALEEVSDLWANTLAFGGQPVGDIGQQQWKCEKNDACLLMKGHSGDCVFRGSPIVVATNLDTGEQVSMSQGEDDAKAT